MSKPITITNVFGGQSGPIPLSQLDANFTQVQNAINDPATYNNYVVDTGVANAYTVTPSPAWTAYAAGMTLQFKAVNVNTTTSTVNVSGLGLKTIKRLDGSNLSAGDIPSGSVVSLQYDGTNFQLQSPYFLTAVINGGTGLATLTANNVMLGNGTSTPSFVAPSTSGNVLTSNGTTWASSSPVTGSYTLVSTQTASSSAALSWTGLTSSRYMLVIEAMIPASGAQSLVLQVGTGGGPTWVTSGYADAMITYDTGALAGSSAETSVASISLDGLRILGKGIGTTAGEGLNGSFLIANMLATGSALLNVSGSGSRQTSTESGTPLPVTIGGNLPGNTTAKTSIRIQMTSGNIASGVASLYVLG